jgi:polar amino acid transport system substrate-binding protein
LRLHLLLWLLIWPVLAVSQDDRTSTTPAMLIRIAAEDNWPPFSDHQGRGLSELLVKAAFATQGYQIRTVVVPYARALHATRQGDTDACWNVTRQHNTEQEFILHKIPLFTADSSFYYYQKPQPYLSVAQIPDGTAVGVILGYEYGDLYEKHKHRFHLVQVSTHAQLIGLLNSGKLDLAIFFDDVLHYYLQQEGIKAPNIQRGQLNYRSEIYLAFSKDNPQSIQRAEALDAGITELKKSGVYQQLLQGIRPESGSLNSVKSIGK